MRNRHRIAIGVVSTGVDGAPRYAIVRDGRERPAERRESRSRGARLVWGVVLALLLSFVVRIWIRGGRAPEPPRAG